MGLVYLFPSKLDESNHISITSNNFLRLESYGLPWIFWGYLAGSLSIIFFLSLAVWSPVMRLLESEEVIDKFLCYLLLSFIPLLCFILIAFFFTGKIIEKKEEQLKTKWKAFGVTVYSKEFQLLNPHALEIGHFLESPNLARTSGKSNLASFQNKGYFELFAMTSDHKKILIDRHSLKTELEKILNLLKSY